MSESDHEEGGEVMLAPGLSVISGPAFPPGYEASLNPFAASQMIYSHAMALYNASYEKDASRFNMSMEDALEVATGFFMKSFDVGLVVSRFRNVAEKLLLRDLYAEIPAPAAAAMETSALAYG